MVGREYDGQALVLGLKPVGDLVGRGIAGNGNILTLDDDVILVGPSSRVVATYADPVYIDVIGRAFPGPDLQGLFDQGETRYGDNDALRLQCLRQEPCSKALPSATWHDELTACVLSLSEVREPVTYSVLLVRTGRARFKDRWLARQPCSQEIEELDIEVLPSVQGAETDPFLAPVEASDTFRRRAY